MRYINSDQDIYKLALLLHGQLMSMGIKNHAEELENVIESCWTSPCQAIDAHRNILKKIYMNSRDKLPHNSVQALEEALERLGVNF